MANLIPEKRMDKTGKLVTRHVRSGPASAAAKTAMPAPSVGANPVKTVVGVKPRSKQLTQQRSIWQNASTFFKEGRPPRIFMENESNPFRAGYLAFEATDAEIYDLLSIVGPGHALELLSHDISTSEDARRYLTENGMEHYLMDNSAFAGEMLSRGVDPTKLIDLLADEGPEVGWNEPGFIEFAELYSSPSLHKQWPKLKDDLLAGHITMKEIRSLGIANVSSRDRLIDSLGAVRALKSPDAKFSLRDLKEVLLLANANKLGGDDYAVVMRMLIECGPKDLPGLAKDLPGVWRVARAYGERHLGAQVLYHLKFDHEMNNWHRHLHKMVIPLQEAGVDPVQAAQMIDAGMQVEAIIAAQKEGITPSVASGWL